VLSFGGTPAASSTSGRAGNSVPSTIVVHFGICRCHLKFRAVLMMSCRVRAATLWLAIITSKFISIIIHELLFIINSLLWDSATCNFYLWFLPVLRVKEPVRRASVRYKPLYFVCVVG